jgi:hypothetical protein
LNYTPPQPRIKRPHSTFNFPPPAGGFKVKQFCIWGANYFITFCTKTETKINVVIVIEKVPDPIYFAPADGFKVKQFFIWGADYFITFCTKTETKINVVIVIEKGPDPIYLALKKFIVKNRPRWSSI